MESLNIDKTAEHGDLWQKNILISNTTSKVSVIDWEYYKPEGNPFFDFIVFLILHKLRG